MPERETFLRQFHAAHAGITSRVLACGGTYARLAACVPAGARVLDVGCGDGYLLSLLAGERVGVDLSRAELALAAARGLAVVQARAEALPFRDGAFDAVVSHLALDVMVDVEACAREAGRVLRAGGTFAAIVGGGPSEDPADAGDAFHRYLALAPPRPDLRLGDPRTRDERAWARWLPGATVERVPVAIDGWGAVWPILAAGYENAGRDTRALRAALHAEQGDRARMTMVFWLVTATIRR